MVYVESPKTENHRPYLFSVSSVYLFCVLGDDVLLIKNYFNIGSKNALLTRYNKLFVVHTWERNIKTFLGKKE